MGKLRRTAIAFISANTLDESRRVLERHRELLLPQADLLMQRLAMEHQDKRARARVETYRALLVRCREVGIAQAFTEQMQASTRPGNVPPTQPRPRTTPPVQGWPETIMPAQSRPETMPPGQVKPETDPSTIAMRLLMAAATGDEEELRTLLNALADSDTTMDPHPTGGQARGVAVPLGFEADIAVAQQLESQSQRDPGAFRSLISVYERILGRLRPGEHPSFRAGLQYNLGNCYYSQPTGERGANLARAIACYHEALRFYTPEAAPHNYTNVQNNMGRAYEELPTGNRGANLMHAIQCYEEALRFLTPEAAPREYALMQYNMGNAYRNLPTGDQGMNLRHAIACYHEALRFWTPEATPLDYALVQHNLGNAYQDLRTGDRRANLARAIECFLEALRFRTPAAAPFKYAMTQTNLGAAYLNLYDYLLPGDREANPAQAIECFQEALRFWTPAAAPLDYAKTQSNLGIAYRNLPAGDQEANMARAIACYREALRFLTPEAAPLDYARTQHNLGIAYLALATGDRGENLARAIECFQETQRFWTPATAPLDYAKTQSNLGIAYRNLPGGDQEANLRHAIACYQEALRFQTPETAPRDCRQTNRNLANLHFAQGDWRAALAAYRVAMDVGDRLYRAGLSAQSKATELSQNAALYRHAAFAAACVGDATEALRILERGKTRILAEALRLRVPRPAHVPDNIWGMFERAASAVRAAHSGDAALPDQEITPASEYTARGQALRSSSDDLDAAVAHVRQHAPDFLKELDLPTVRALLPDAHTALVAFCITDQGSMGLVLSQNHDEAVRAVNVPGFTQTDLLRLLIERDATGGPGGGWLGDYARYAYNGRKDADWRTLLATITRVLTEVGRRLLVPILAALPPSIERLILIPSGNLFFLPLHAAPLSVKGSELVCDRYQVSYAPSAEVLSSILAKLALRAADGSAQADGRTLYAVINPVEDPDLFFTPAEGTAIAGLFAECEVHEGRAGTKMAIAAGVRGRSYIHFSCHGSYMWIDPPESGLDLADGRLTLAELQRGKVDLSAARLITLSACETGLSDIGKGSAEEYVGLPAGFMLAGAPCVVSSLWAVLDISTALVMERFYRNHLKGGLDFAAALREAQIWVRGLSMRDVAGYAEQCYQLSQQRNKAELLKYAQHYRHQAEQDPTMRPFAHPYYWAAFTVNGM